MVEARGHPRDPPQQRPEHRVGAVPVRPELEGAGQRTGAVRYVGQQGRGVARAPRPTGSRAPADTTRTSRPGPASRSRRAPRRPAAPSRGPPTSRACCSGTSASRSVGCRRQRASGRRRSAPRPGAGRVHEHPVERAGGPRRAGAVAGDHAQHAVGTAERAPDQVRRGAAAARWPAARPPAGRQRRQQRGLAAGSGAEVQPAQVGPVERRRGQGERDQLRALVLHAGPALGHGRRRHPGRRRPGARRTATSAVGSPGSSSTGRAPGTGDQGHPRRLVVGRQQRLDLALPDGLGERLHHPARVGVGDARGTRPGRRRASGATRATQPSRSCSETRRSTALANPAAPGPTSERTRSTVVLIAAWAGTRMASSWWVPSRSASSTRACTLASGRSMQAASTAS